MPNWWHRFVEITTFGDKQRQFLDPQTGTTFSQRTVDGIPEAADNVWVFSEQHVAYEVPLAYGTITNLQPYAPVNWQPNRAQAAVAPKPQRCAYCGKKFVPDRYECCSCCGAPKE